MTAKAYMLDTNLMVLFTVGSFDVGLIERHKRCRGFDMIDYRILCNMLVTAREIVCTPHCLAEAFNLVRAIGEPLRSKLTAHFGCFLPLWSERFIESGLAASRQSFVRLGLTDAALLAPAVGDVELLTTDFDLYRIAMSDGRAVSNLRHLRASLRFDS